MAVISSSSSGPNPNPLPLARRGSDAPPGAPLNTALIFTAPTGRARHAACAWVMSGVSTLAGQPLVVVGFHAAQGVFPQLARRVR